MRTAIISVIGVFAAVAANAGVIEIGSGLNGATGISTGGLNVAYFGTSTPPPATNGFSEKGYATTLFVNDTISNSSLNGVNGGTGTTMPGLAAGQQQLVDPNNNVPFAMIANSLNGGTNPDSSGSNPNDNYWGSFNSSPGVSSSITVPINIADVGRAWIMLSDYWGVGGGQTSQFDTVTFNFASAGPVNFFLYDGVQIDAATACSSAGTFTGSPACTTYAQTTTSPNTSVAWSANYTNTSSSTSLQYSGTSGTLSLIDIAFDLSGYSTDTLNSITVNDNNSKLNNSRLALSAITVQTPEPSTVVLLLAGFGLIGFYQLRRRRA